MILLVTYDLHNPGRDYKAIAEVLESADSSTHPLESVWIIDTQRTPKTWLEELKAAGDNNDEYFVVRLQESWWSTNLDRSSIAWLKDPARTW